MRYFDTDMFYKEQRAFEQEIVCNYYRDDWIRLSGRSWEDRPDHLKELHCSFEFLRANFPLDGEQADEFRAEMERVRNALKAEYDTINK